MVLMRVCVTETEEEKLAKKEEATGPRAISYVCTCFFLLLLMG